MEENISDDKPVEPPGDVESRIQYLEAQNEGLKRVGLLALILIAIIGGLFVFQVWNDLKVQATAGIVLHDDKHEGKMLLTISPQGSLAIVPINPLGGAPGLEKVPDVTDGVAIYDQEGHLRIAFGTLQGHAVMGVQGTNGKLMWQALGPQSESGKPGSSPTPGASPKPSSSPAESPSPKATP